MGDTDFFGRVGELESLQDAYDSRIAEMAIIYGHRRIGKTALIQKFCEGKPAFFYTAKAWKDPYQLDRFSQAVGTFCGNPQLRYLEWTSALRALATQPSPSRKVIVIDEFQYIAKERPSFRCFGTRSCLKKTFCWCFVAAPCPLSPKKFWEKRILFTGEREPS